MRDFPQSAREMQYPGGAGLHAGRSRGVQRGQMLIGGAAAGALQPVFSLVEADEAALRLIAAGAEGALAHAACVEPVKPVLLKQVLREVEDIFKALQADFEHAHLIAQGDAARLHLHEQMPRFFRLAGSKKIVDFLEAAIVQHGSSHPLCQPIGIWRQNL